METIELLKLVFPQEIVENFTIVKAELNSKEERLDVYLEENKILPSYLADLQVVSDGLTAATTIQDYPIRGNAVFLHIKRRKWLDITTKKIYTKSYDLTATGSQLTTEFVAFLKEADRRYGYKL